MNILIVTGERSAENYASLLVDEIGIIDSSAKFFSVCSDILNKKTKKVADFRDISVIGAKEAFKIANKAYLLLKKIKEEIKNKNIDLVILMDFPEFNMKIMKFAKKLDKKVVYYISPQVWAWRSYRIKALFEYTDLVIPILPFEKTFFKVRHIDKKKIAYCGHPLVDLLHDKMKDNPKRENIILIMPGSRKSEMEYNCKTMFDAGRLIKNSISSFRFVWVVPEYMDNEFINKQLEDFEFIETAYDAHSLMRKAYFGILKSGTTTLEAAMLNLPMVVSYKISKMSYYVGKALIRGINYISLPNLIYGDQVVKELIEDKATPEAIFEQFSLLHNNSYLYNDMIKKLKKISFSLGDYPVTRKIAQSIYGIV